MIPENEIREHKSINRYLFKRVGVIAFFWAIIYMLIFLVNFSDEGSLNIISFIIRFAIYFLLVLCQPIFLCFHSVHFFSIKNPGLGLQENL